jgi:hypothetical protein
MDLNNEVAEATADDDLIASLTTAFDEADEGAHAPADVPAQETKPEETAEQAAERVRDEKGRFAAKVEEPAKVEAKAVEQPKLEVAAQAAAPAGVEPVVTDATLRPPPGWSPAAKVAFAALPPEVQQSVAKREDEVNKGFAKLAEYKPLERFAEMARQSGTTLDRALENYTGIEQALRRDFVAGIGNLCQRQGVDPVALANVILARNGVTPTQPGEAGAAPQANQNAQRVDLSPIMQKISALENHIQQQQSQGVQSEIQRFASDPKNTFFDNVKEQMGHLINAGVAADLADAYDKACWANPEIRGLLIKQQSAPSDQSAAAKAATQARQAAKSITGSPIAGASKGGPALSIEDEIRALMDASV